MIILIGGASCTGKTMLAQKLLEKFKITYLSLDHLKMGLIRSENCKFKVLDSDEDIEDEFWPITLGMIKTNIENHQNIIIEGCYLPHDEIEKLKRQYPQEVQELFLGLSKRYIKEHYQNGIIEYRNVIEKRLFSEERNIEMMIDENEKQKRQCEKHHLHFLEIQDDYEKEILKAFQIIKF